MGTLADIEAARRRLADWHGSDAKAKDCVLGRVNWTYRGDERVEAIDRLPVVVMGFNAGAGNGATATRLSPGEKRWRTNCSKIAAGIGDEPNQGRFVLAELIPLASFNERELVERYGRLERAFQAGADVNTAVIAYHEPKVIFQTGINPGHLAIVEPLYGLTFKAAVSRPGHPSHTLLRHYEMPDGRPWLATMHFATVGFSTIDMDAIRRFSLAMPLPDPA